MTESNVSDRSTGISWVYVPCMIPIGAYAGYFAHEYWEIRHWFMMMGGTILLFCANSLRIWYSTIAPEHRNAFGKYLQLSAIFGIAFGLVLGSLLYLSVGALTAMLLRSLADAELRILIGGCISVAIGILVFLINQPNRRKSDSHSARSETMNEIQ